MPGPRPGKKGKKKGDFPFWQALSGRPSLTDLTGPNLSVRPASLLAFPGPKVNSSPPRSRPRRPKTTTTTTRDETTRHRDDQEICAKYLITTDAPCWLAPRSPTPLAHRRLAVAPFASQAARPGAEPLRVPPPAARLPPICLSAPVQRANPVAACRYYYLRDSSSSPRQRPRRHSRLLFFRILLGPAFPPWAIRLASPTSTPRKTTHHPPPVISRTRATSPVADHDSPTAIAIESLLCPRG